MTTRLTDLSLGMWTDPTEAFRKTQGDEPMAWQVPYLWETRNVVLLKGRQVGASTCASVLCIRHTKLNPMSLAAIVSPSMKQSTEVKQRSKAGLLHLGEQLAQDSQSTIGLGNGSRIISLPGSPKSVRGWSVDLLVIDEAAFLDPETFLAARATVAATGGRTIVQSTPAGPYGHFFDLWEEAVDPEDAKNDPTVKWVRYRVSSEDVSTISPAFLANERATLTEDEYAQEYLGKFSAPGMGLVDPEKLKELRAEAAPDDPWAALR